MKIKQPLFLEAIKLDQVRKNKLELKEFDLNSTSKLRNELTDFPYYLLPRIRSYSCWDGSRIKGKGSEDLVWESGLFLA